MTLPEIKQISIRQYLANMGIRPEKDRSYYGMYRCPYRDDHNASFKVDYNQNLWYDFGTNDGGSIIDLVMRLNNCTVGEAINRLEGRYAKIQPSNQSNQKASIHTDVNTNIRTDVHTYDSTSQRSNVATFQHSNVASVKQYINTTAQQPNATTAQHVSKADNHAITLKYILPITNPKLIAWVQERKIPLDLAKHYIKEVHYQNDGRDYYAIGFRNDRGGYELCSPPNFKTCYPPKEIKTFRNDGKACLVFEGMWDFLSYLTFRNVVKTMHDVAILNSVTNLQKAMAFIKKHMEAYTFLDNDEAGRKATELIKSAHPTVYNQSKNYSGYKDMNDYLCDKPMIKPEVKKKKTGMKI